MLPLCHKLCCVSTTQHQEHSTRSCLQLRCLFCTAQAVLLALLLLLLSAKVLSLQHSSITRHTPE
jgi:hypothetical protein